MEYIETSYDKLLVGQYYAYKTEDVSVRRYSAVITPLKVVVALFWK